MAITRQKLIDALAYLEIIHVPEEMDQIMSVYMAADEIVVSRVAEVVYTVENDEDDDEDQKPDEGLSPEDYFRSRDE